MSFFVGHFLKIILILFEIIYFACYNGKKRFFTGLMGRTDVIPDVQDEMRAILITKTRKGGIK